MKIPIGIGYIVVKKTNFAGLTHNFTVTIMLYTWRYLAKRKKMRGLAK